jgi:hypothetical protein
MKYQQIIMARRVSPDDGEFRQFYVPVEERDGTWVPCGPMREETHRVTHAAMFGSIDEYEHGGGETCGPLSGIEAPPGWFVASRLWLPENYVPPSDEVREEGYRRAEAYLKEMLGDE